MEVLSPCESFLYILSYIFRICHCFDLLPRTGLEDLYDGADPLAASGIGAFDIMADPYGQNGDPDYPGHLSVLSKIWAEWIAPKEIKENGIYTLKAAEVSDEAYRITLADYGVVSEYLLIENRQPLEYDRDIWAGGLVIYHIDDAADLQMNKGYPGQDGWPENGNHYFVAVLPKDGLYNLEKGDNNGDAGDMWLPGDVLGPGEGNTVFPNTDLYQGGFIQESGYWIQVLSQEGTDVTFRVGGFDGDPPPDGSEVTKAPTLAPTAATKQPTLAPTKAPTLAPTAAIKEPTLTPSTSLTKSPATSPTMSKRTVAPTAVTTESSAETAAPTLAPTLTPTTRVTIVAPDTTAPTLVPTPVPTAAAGTSRPTTAPSIRQTQAPTPTISNPSPSPVGFGQDPVTPMPTQMPVNVDVYLSSFRPFAAAQPTLQPGSGGFLEGFGQSSTASPFASNSGFLNGFESRQDDEPPSSYLSGFGSAQDIMLSPPQKNNEDRGFLADAFGGEEDFREDHAGKDIIRSSSRVEESAASSAASLSTLLSEGYCVFLFVWSGFLYMLLF